VQGAIGIWGSTEGIWTLPHKLWLFCCVGDSCVCSAIGSGSGIGMGGAGGNLSQYRLGKRIVCAGRPELHVA